MIGSCAVHEPAELAFANRPYAASRCGGARDDDRGDGKRFAAADFNFWGVTFARESNTFYALQTACKTYLVRGDLGLRKLTVLHENVECPSLSPDNRLIAYIYIASIEGSEPARVFLPAAESPIVVR